MFIKSIRHGLENERDAAETFEADGQEIAWGVAPSVGYLRPADELEHQTLPERESHARDNHGSFVLGPGLRRKAELNLELRD